jgi:beta-lactamase regulating signal transducer with metallopeptidase domain
MVLPSAIVFHVAAPPLLTAPAAVPMASIASVPTAAPAPASDLPSFDPAGVAQLLFGLWFAGFAWQMLRLGIGAFALRRLRSDSRPYSLAPAACPKVDFRGRECELRLSRGDQGPMTWGFSRSVVLLPEAAQHWSPERLKAVLLHELAHVRRRDSLTQSLARVLAAIYWLNPLVWLGLKGLSAEAEMASDDTVLGFGLRPSDYAGELVRLASEFRGHGLAVSGVSMASQSSLSARVKSVLATDRQRAGATRNDMLKFLSIGVAATAVLALAHPALGAPDKAEQQTQATATSGPASQQDDRNAPAMHRVMQGGDHHLRHQMHVMLFDRDGHELIDQAEMDRAMADMKRAHAELQRIGPDIHRALADAHVEERVAKAMADAHIDAKIRIAINDAHIDETMRQAMRTAHARQTEAMAKAEPRIRAALLQAHRAMQDAMAQGHIDEKVAKAMAKAQAHIDAALKGHRGHVIVETDGGDDEDAAVSRDDNNNADDEGDSETEVNPSSDEGEDR